MLLKYYTITYFFIFLQTFFLSAIWLLFISLWDIYKMYLFLCNAWS